MECQLKLQISGFRQGCQKSLDQYVQTLLWNLNYPPFLKDGPKFRHSFQWVHHRIGTIPRGKGLSRYPIEFFSILPTEPYNRWGWIIRHETQLAGPTQWWQQIADELDSPPYQVPLGIVLFTDYDQLFIASWSAVKTINRSIKHNSSQAWS